MKINRRKAGVKKEKKNKWERRLSMRERERRGKESEKGRKLLNQFMGRRREEK